MPLQFKPGPAPDTHDAYSGQQMVGRILRSPEGGWFWSLLRMRR